MLENEGFGFGFWVQKCSECLNKQFMYLSVLSALYEEFASLNNMTVTNMKILHAIYYSGCKKQHEITKKYGLSRKTVNSSIKNMSDSSVGWVILNDEDKNLSLTQSGTEQAKKIERFFIEIVKGIESELHGSPENILQHFNTNANIIIESITRNRMKKDRPHA